MDRGVTNSPAEGQSIPRMMGWSGKGYCWGKFTSLRISGNSRRHSGHRRSISTIVMTTRRVMDVHTSSERQLPPKGGLAKGTNTWPLWTPLPSPPTRRGSGNNRGFGLRDSRIPLWPDRLRYATSSLEESRALSSSIMMCGRADRISTIPAAC